MYKILEKVGEYWCETSGMGKGQFSNPYYSLEMAREVARKVAGENGTRVKILRYFN